MFPQFYESIGMAVWVIENLFVVVHIDYYVQAVGERIIYYPIDPFEEIRIDCDDDTVLLKVEQVGGAACHTGHKSCFHKMVDGESIRMIGKPVFNPEEVYNR